VYFLAHFCPVAFFPPNNRAQNNAQENPLLVLFLLSLDTKSAKNHTFLKSWIIWEAVGLEISFYKRLQQKLCPET
jgi:hypothetical protein